ncbi:MAG TPA: vanadium-dependent haloperoxidase [Anaeromyxobacteraceae bacterium]|nr:vanadium-dependent haloperoxidase [Anaeromyxobacteraceae bacterium]
MTTACIRILAGAAITAAALTAAPAAADVVTDWNQVAIQATAIPPNAMLQARVLAAAHVAMLEALQAASSLDPGGRDAAAAAAAYGVLSRLTSGQADALDAALKRTVDAVPAGAAKTDGLALGTQTAERIVAQRRSDGADAKVAFTPTPGAGRWQPTPPANAPAILPHWGSVKPFVLDSATRFPLKGPPKLDSPQLARELDEVRSVGARLSATRTADQTAAAIFWTVQTPVPWNAAARAAAAAHATTREENARLFAALNVACSDAHIAAFEAKYRLQHWRPITAIRARAAPGSKDATWEPLLGTPAHPEYPSTHATCSGAAEAVLKGFFGSDEVAVSVTHPPVFGVTRSYTSFSQMAGEVDDARVWGGIHFRSADDDGRDLGRRVGEYVLARFPAPRQASR